MLPNTSRPTSSPDGRDGPQQPQGQGSQGEEDSEALEDLRCCRASLLRCGLLLPLLGQGHGA